MAETWNFSCRYGGIEYATDPSRFAQLIQKLIDGLCDELFARPDYEHSDVYVSHPNGWTISASMDGDIALSNWPVSSTKKYLYGLSKDELLRLFLMLCEGRMDEINAMKWHDEPIHGKGDHFLLLNQTDISDTHRAACKGDCDWIRSELAAGADIEARDRHGATPLHYAAIAGNLEACRLLIEEGADLDCEDVCGASIVDYAEGSREYISPDQVQKLIVMLLEAQTMP